MIKILSYFVGAAMMVGGLIVGAIKWGDSAESTKSCGDPTQCGLLTHFSFTAHPVLGCALIFLAGAIIIWLTYGLTNKTNK